MNLQCGSCGYEFSGNPPRGHVLAYCPKCEGQRASPVVLPGDEIDVAIEYVIAAADLLGWTFAAHGVGEGSEAHTDGFVIGSEEHVDAMTEAYRKVKDGPRW